MLIEHDGTEWNETIISAVMTKATSKTIDGAAYQVRPSLPADRCPWRACCPHDDPCSQRHAARGMQPDSCLRPVTFSILEATLPLHTVTHRYTPLHTVTYTPAGAPLIGAGAVGDRLE